MRLEDESNRGSYRAPHDMESADIQQGAALYLAKVMGWMCVGLLTTMAAATVCLSVPAIYGALFSPTAMYGICIGQLVLVLFFSFRLQKMSPAVATVSFMAYSALTGVTVSLLALLFEMTSIIFIAGITGLLFLTMAVYGFVTRADLTGIGKLALFGLLGVILAGLANWFLRSAMLDFIVCVVAVIVFIALIAYDTQKVKGFYFQAVADSLSQ